MTIKIYEVGGAVRDEILGLPTKDIDYSVESKSFEHIIDCLNQSNFDIFLTTPEYFTIRARFPKGLNVWADRNVKGLTADFVWARKEGPYSDGRHPDWVKPGTLEDDLARRDFTMNAIAKDIDGKYIDPFDGRRDVMRGCIRAVGSAEERLREDPLRALRALRFAITKDFFLDWDIIDVLRSKWLPEALESVSVERKREELHKMFKHDTFRAAGTLMAYRGVWEAVMPEGMWLKPTLEK